ncbi:MAG: superinfection immunity protein [Akkermansiaceae bacterium]|nr:superinfection immunity protein [Akkermansiaceae bacterium]
MDSHPAPLPPEAYFDEHRRRGHRHHGSAAIPSWGWWVIGLALISVGAAGGYLYFGQDAIIKSLPRATVITCWALFGIGALVFYLLPTLISRSYGIRHRNAITAMNLCLSWSLIACIAPQFFPLLPQVDVHTAWVLIGVTFIQWSAALVWSIGGVESSSH